MKSKAIQGDKLENTEILKEVITQLLCNSGYSGPKCMKDGPKCTYEAKEHKKTDTDAIRTRASEEIPLAGVRRNFRDD